MTIQPSSEQLDELEWDVYHQFMQASPEAKQALLESRPPVTQETPAKHRKGGDKGPKGKGKSGGKGKTPPHQQVDQAELTALRLICNMLIRLAIRHEDMLKTLQLDTSFILWMRTGLPLGIPEGLFKVAEKWRADKEVKQHKTSLRQVLWMCVWKEFQQRLHPARLTAEIQSSMTKLGFLKDGLWLYLKWAPEENRLIPDTTRKGIAMEEALELVSGVVRLSEDVTILTKFVPTRPLAAELRGPSLTFLASIANRTNPSDQLFASLTSLCGNACCQVIGMSLKPERLTRSTLAQQLLKHLPAASSHE